MTIFGPDISSYQAGLDLSRLADASFVLAKTTEGTYYTDAAYQGWRSQARTLGLPFIWYHFLSGEDPHAQAQHTLAHAGDTSLPGMLDAEPAGSFSPSLAQMVAYTDAAHSVGLNLRLLYLPHWYWQQMGSPNLTALRTRGLSLVSSSYPGGSGSAPRLYPGDAASGWNSYGGMAPLLYQFTNQASDAGRPLDYNAFRGTAAELATALGGTPTTTSGGTMSGYTMSAGWQNDYPDVAAALQRHIPVGTVVDEADAAAYAMIRSFIAAERAGAIEAKLDQLLARPAAAPADVNALAAALVTPLAAALAPHISGGVDVDQVAQAVAEPVAHAVLAHMADDLRAG